MITLTIILTTIITLAIIVGSILLAGGIGFLTVFGDVFVAIVIIMAVVKMICYFKHR